MPKTEQAKESGIPEYGWRYLKVARPDGREDIKIVPLREEDLLHPQEGDFLVQNDFHISDVFYLLAVFRSQTAGKKGLRVLGDHLIDFQHGDVQPLGPDVTVLNGEQLDWDRSKATFPVGDMKARPLFVVEITSPSTRKKDLGPKLNLYFRAGIPLYVIVDAPYGGGRPPMGVVAYQAGPEFYEVLDVAENGRFWLDIVDVWVGIEDGHVACYDANGRRLSAPEEALRELRLERARADEERARADQADARANQADARANQADARANQADARANEEKARADAAEARVRELEEKMKKPKRRKK